MAANKLAESIPTNPKSKDNINRKFNIIIIIIAKIFEFKTSR